MAFLKEPVPERGKAVQILPGVSRIVANNPSLMTYHGTNTYLIADGDTFVVLDPGPNDDGHLEDIMRATGGKIRSIIVSHTHSDHLGATAALKLRTGAKTHAFHIGADDAFTPDVLLRDGDEAEGLSAIHTPGHASDHLCFAWRDRIVFSADHVMSWSSSIVSPPDGNMSDYIANLERMIARGDRLYLPGHGPPLPDPVPYVEQLLAYRLKRENAIEQALAEGPAGTWDLVDQLYSKTDEWLRRAAERNVLAHLLKLKGEGRACQRGDLWTAI